MATSAEKLAEIQAKAEQEKIEKAETAAIQKLYSQKYQFDNSRNKTANVEKR